MDNTMLQQILDKLQEMESGIKELKIGQEKLKDVPADVEFIRGRVVLIEEEHGQKLGMLFDGQTMNIDTLKEHTKHLERIETKVDKLDVRVDVHDIQIDRMAK